MSKGIVFDIKEMSVNDGPGLRTSVFLKGCPLRCNWCHNPEGLSPEPQLRESGPDCARCGKCFRGCGHPDCRPYGRCLHACPLGRLRVCGREMEAGALADGVKRQEAVLRDSGGGVTLTGGEPLLQGEFLLELMEKLRPLHIAVETSGYADQGLFEEMLKRCDLVMIDLKHMDDDIHRKYTGVGNGLIHKNAVRVMESGRPFIARVPLIPGVTDTARNLEETAGFLSSAGSLIRVELMPYNALAGAKYPSVCREYRPEFDARLTPQMDCGAFDDRKIKCVVL